MKINPLLTLQSIRDHQPCREGWTKLFKAQNRPSDFSMKVSLGDIAFSNGATDAFWCVRALNWRDIEVRRAVISGAVLPTLKRTLWHTTDKDIHNCLAVLEQWVDGRAELSSLKDAARPLECGGQLTDPVPYAARATWRAAHAALATCPEFGADGVFVALLAVASGNWIDAEARGDAEREAQRQDIIFAFPPVTRAVLGLMA